jgi:multiple sugar transport system substrate-binding protein
MRPTDRKQFLANIVDRYVRGGMDRRSFLRATAKLGLGAARSGWLRTCRLRVAASSRPRRPRTSVVA